MDTPIQMHGQNVLSVDYTSEWTEPKKLENNHDDTESQTSSSEMFSNESESPHPFGTTLIGGKGDTTYDAGVVGKEPATPREGIDESSAEGLLISLVRRI